jgi:hypothetical protein
MCSGGGLTDSSHKGTYSSALGSDDAFKHPVAARPRSRIVVKTHFGCTTKKEHQHSFIMSVYVCVSYDHSALSGRGGRANRRGSGVGRNRTDRIGGGSATTATAAGSICGCGSGFHFCHWRWFLIVVVVMHRSILELCIRRLLTIIQHFIIISHLSSIAISNHI